MSANESRVALVTGAAKRLGAATARLLHEQGYRIVVHYNRSSAEAEALSDELNAARAGSAVAIGQELGASDCAEGLVDRTIACWDRLDLLVNNASVFFPTPVDTIDVATWDAILAVNVRAPYFLAVRAAPHLRRHGGCVVNVGDVNAERPRPDYSAYCASKAALLAVTRSLALDLGPEVRVNAVSPGAIMWADDEDDDVRRVTVERTPLQRTGTPEDIAQAVAYLAQAPFVTGHTINVDGGRVVRI